jgi:hypothetical protein
LVVAEIALQMEANTPNAWIKTAQGNGVLNQKIPELYVGFAEYVPSFFAPSIP